MVGIATLIWFPLYLQLGHGEFSAANTRVLRMVNTLGVENEAKQTIEALQAELQKTRERLLAVEELKSQSGKFLIVDLFLFLTLGLPQVYHLISLSPQNTLQAGEACLNFSLSL